MSDDPSTRQPRDWTDEEIDLLLAAVGHREPLAESPSETPEELSWQRLRGEAFPDEDRRALLEQLAANPTARAAWFNRAEERPDADPAVVERIADHIQAIQLAEGVPALAARRRAIRRVALAVAAVLVIGTGLFLTIGDRVSPGGPAPAYAVDLEGAIKEFRDPLVEPHEAGPPAFAPASTVVLLLSPAAPVEDEDAWDLRIAGSAPDGTVALWTEPVQIERRNGTFKVTARAEDLFGEQGGAWQLVCFVEPAGRPAADRVLRAQVAQVLEASGDAGGVQLPRGVRAYVIPLEYRP